MTPTDQAAPVDVLVLREGVHGMPASDYRDALRERLPDRTVRLARTPGEERTLLPRARVATGPRLPEPLLDAIPEAGLELFACAYAGTEHLPLRTFAEAGVAVTNAAGVHAPNVAEYVCGALLTEARGFDRAATQATRGEWQHFATRDLQGSTAVVVGLGAIGSAVCERLDAFGVTTVGVRRRPEQGGVADTVVGPDAFDERVADADHLVLACPLTEATRGLVDRETFRTLPPAAHLVNVARGPVVDTEALVDALRRNRLGAATLDVTDPEPLPQDHPLWDLARVTPHNAGHTPAYYDRLAGIVATNVPRLDGDEPLRNRIEVE